MKKFLMIASAAAIAVTMPTLATAKGGGQGQGGDKAAKADKAPKQQKAAGNAFKQAGKAEQRQAKSADRSFKQAEKAQKQSFKSAERSAKAQNKAVERQYKDQYKAEAKQAGRARDARFGDDRWNDGRNRNFAANGAACPPGLAKKSPACVPPGQARKLGLGQPVQNDWYPQYNLPQQYRDLYTDNASQYYRYDENGYIYRVNRADNLVSGLIPLLGGGFSVGQTLPTGYDIYNVPLQYRDTYFDTDDLYYRFGDNAIYQVDPQTQVIQNVVALLTGDSFGVGQQMPAGYDMYNLPMQYRDQYADTDDYNYRYADGNIYQVDPQTQIVQAIISALI